MKASRHDVAYLGSVRAMAVGMMLESRELTAGSDVRERAWLGCGRVVVTGPVMVTVMVGPCHRPMLRRTQRSD